MDTVVKHGSHNQKDHGRGKGGGTLRNQDEPMDPETAWVHSTTWYHGTSRPDLVTLDASQAPSRYPGMGSSYSLMAHNFATNDRELAAQYARDAVDMDMKNGITGARAVVYEVKPTSDYFDPDPHSGPGGWNDGPEDMSVARELVDGGGGVSIRFHDEMDIVGAFDADTGEPITVQKMAEMVKHGSHNQASHNPHKGGASEDLPEGWSRQSRESVIARWEKVSREQHEATPEKAREFAERKADLNDYYDGPNGSVVCFEKLQHDVPQASRDRLLNQVAEMQQVAPVPGMEVTVGLNAYRYYGEDPRSVGGFAMLGEPRIFLAPRSVTTGFKNDPEWLMPSIRGNTKKYPLAHEWGHTIDGRSRGNAYDDWMAVSKLSGMSKYGRSDSRESFAEAFVDWHLTGGKTTSEAVAYYRDKYNWGSEGGVTMAKAAQQAVTIVADTFGPEGATVREIVPPDPVEWELAQAITKSVFVAFEPGLRPVLKHGSHDQKSHGRRGGGSSMKLDEGVAQSIVERVRANGGLSVNMVDGSEPTKGYMVAMGGTKGAIMDADEFYDPVRGPEALGSFMKSNRELSEGSYLGLWHNQADGKVYLDVSENIMDRATAIDAGRKRDQISIWDVANFEEIDTGGTGQLGKAVAGSETAEPEVDDGRGDRRIRKDSVGEVRGGRGVFVAFEPGLRPVLKHGDHDQSSHGRRGGGSRLTPGDTGPAAEAYRRRELADVPGRYSPPGTETFPERKSPPPVGRRGDVKTWQEEYVEQQNAIADALVSGNFDNLDIPPSRLAQQIGAAQGEVLRRIDRVARRIGLKREKRWQYTEDEAISLRESYYEKYGRPSWMDKAVRRIRKHLGGAHDQKTHGRGGGGGDKGWGDRQKDIDAMANVGPSRDALMQGATGISEDDVRQYVTDTWGDTIEADARQAVADDMEAEGWVDRSDDPDYEEPLMGNTYQQEFDERLAQRIEDDTDIQIANYDYDIREGMAQEMGLDVDTFDEVYGVTHEGISVTGDRVQLSTRVESVTTGDAWDQNVDVRGSIYDGNGSQVGEFRRRFFIDDDGRLAASHELLDIWDEQHQGTGFSKVFNKQAEDFYISRGITDVHIHAALSVGGYAWAKQGFDWGENGGAGWSVKGKMDDILSLASSDPSLGGVVRSGRELRARLDLPSSDPDYPTTREVASWGYVQGASTWPGKATLIGSDWYGKKTLSPDGPRRSTTEQQAAEAAAAQVAEIPGQQALFN